MKKQTIWMSTLGSCGASIALVCLASSPLLAQTKAESTTTESVVSSPTLKSETKIREVVLKELGQHLKTGTKLENSQSLVKVIDSFVMVKSFRAAVEALKVKVERNSLTLSDIGTVDKMVEVLDKAQRGKL